ncbi:Histidine--tRNA ligase, cytoplasmic [Phytophthora rubi]|uniref:Histidine--tRNA ligase, cytoplasmic n=1 Tax=Phytophthora rubi TaxID=129364 RepID=A0A6A3N8U2_9STRA|nr:Histidine--tRNA ligase, cytoplasmic [Phytophthora rubi]KAE9038050.1 Histidine--tRNA ligase, cytoplasmic [Phytophthora rubi]KAE9342844.1 Histidine--tRNA ligase, cytoplasmic [Phytophthora rubi]
MASARVTVGAGRLSVADVCSVAALKASVALDASAEATAVSTASFTLQLSPSSSSSAVSLPVRRAVLLLLLHRLLRLQSLENAKYVASLLNEADKTPAHVSSIDLPVALAPAQQSAISGTPLALLAETALAVGGARALLPVADAVAAVTCEALRADAAAFEAEFVDAARPHRGIVTSAQNLRLMLDGSKFINSQKDGATDVAAVRCIPQYHGPARDAVLVAYKAVEEEINGAVGDSAAAKRAGAGIHPQALKTALSATKEALHVLLQGSVDRLHVLDSSATDAPQTADAVELVDAAAAALARELVPSFKFFEEEEAQLKLRQAEKNAKAQEAAAKAAAAAAKEDEKLAAMSEAQRNKILEKRRKKLEKQKEKDNAKKSSKDELKVGLGSQTVRQHLLALGGAWQTSVEKSAFDLRASGFSLFLEDLFVRLGSGGARRKPKIAKGSQDFLPHQMALREKIFNKIRMVFKRHAGVEIETPVFELKETLTGKYGEDSKLIYDLADQGGELLALRYDLTVPFARFMALHSPGNIKRYHIARVYRRDNPQMARGRFREFYQCDFDIAGTYAPMLPDAEVLSIGIEVLQQFPELGPVKVKLSHRLLLDAILAICGVPADKFRTTCSAIDKLDKEPWSEVRREMVEEKDIPEAVADRIEPFVCKVGSPRELHAQLVKENMFGDNVNARRAMNDLALLFNYLEAMGVLDYISFDLSLARGLDYYTGLIYEFVLTSPEHHVGSIAAGGRYDNLVGMFSATDQQIPCVGVSLGIERIFGILQAHAEKQSANAAPPSQVLVASTSNDLMMPRLELCKQLWLANISAEVMQTENPKFIKQLHYALERGTPYMVVIGEDELAKGVVKVKEMASKDEVTVPRSELVAELLRRGCPTTSTLSI